MKTISLFITTIFILFSAADLTFSQTPTPTPYESDVVKISTKLVQIDLIVVDKDRNAVATLDASDFEILQDGKPQKITNFTYVKRRLDDAVPVQKADNAKTPTVFPPPIKLEPNEVGRVITFVVSASSFFGRVAAREAIEKFIREQMLPNDLIAIHGAEAGTSRLQQFTNDRQKLLNSLRALGGVPRLASPGDELFNSGSGANEREEEKKIRERREAAANDPRYNGDIGAVNAAVAQMRGLGGRKMVFLISEGLPLLSEQGLPLDKIKALREVTDAANRSGVVINTIDARGVTNPSFIDMKRELSVLSGVRATDKVIDSRWRGERASQDGLILMAGDTGGRYYQNQNYLDTAIKEALKPETGYYLIGYEPEENSFKGKKFNKITAKVKIPGLKVLSRPGYLTEPDPELNNPRIYANGGSIETPWSARGLNIDLTALPESTAAGQSFVRTLIHISADEIAFTDEPNGTKKAIIDVLAATLDERGKIVDQFNRTHTLRFDPVTAERIKRYGLVYSTDVPVKKPGNYNFFVIVHDTTSDLRGSANEVLTVPKVKNSGLTVGGLIVSGVDENGKFETPAATTAETAVSAPLSTAGPAIRRFKRGSVVAYSYSIYNTRLDKTTNQPKITIQVNLYKDGKLIAEGAPTPWKPEGQPDLTRISDFAYMRLSQTEAGEYALQLIVRDTLGGKDAVSSQWVDFDVVD